MKIIVGMSGGVDSTIAAYILKKKGHEVLGVNFNFTRMGEHREPDVVATRRGELREPLVEIAKKLDIEIITRDYTRDFHDKIITSFVRDYESGITPNPCALCNATMKFEKLLEVMREEGADMVATGHYANISKCESRNCRGELCEPSYCIRKSDNHQKDQSYMLYRLSQDELSHIIFPLANMDKEEVRAIAKDLELPNATAKDSQDVCFIASPQAKPHVGASYASPLDYKEFIRQFELGPDYKERIARGELSKDDIEKLPFLKKGEFVDTQGKVLGFHNGIINYTVGQRRGVNIAFGERKFVVRIDAEKNQVVLGSNEELFSDRFKIYDLVFSGYNASAKPATRMGEACARALTKRACRAKCDKVPLGCEPITYTAKLRYRHEGTPCDIDLSTFECRLHEPVRAITPGQSAVFYDDEGRIMFGGRIAL